MSFRNIAIVLTTVVIIFWIVAESSNTVRINPVEGQHAFKGIPNTPEQSIGVCLSGGGYRATLFHLGMLWRMNELGMLPRIGSITAVSGGAILAAHVGLVWDDLVFSDETDIASNFYDVVIKPVLNGTSATIDVPSIVIGALTPSSASVQLVSRLNKNFYQNKKLTDFTADGPSITLRASAVQTKTGWWFSREYMGGEIFGILPVGDTEVAVAVASSAGYPPLLAPTILDVSRLPGVERGWRERENRFDSNPQIAEFWSHRNESIEAIAKDFKLADGGIINNIGSEGCLNVDIKDALIVSSASGFDSLIVDVGNNWLSQGMRAIDMTYLSKERYITENLFRNDSREGRTIILSKLSGSDIGRFVAGREKILQAVKILADSDNEESSWAKGVYDAWTVNLQKRYQTLEKQAFNLMVSASVPTRLKGLSRKSQQDIFNAGYMMFENNLRRAVDKRHRIKRKTFEIMLEAENKVIKGKIVKSLRELSPDWIPHYWTAAPVYFELYRN